MRIYSMGELLKMEFPPLPCASDFTPTAEQTPLAAPVTMWSGETVTLDHALAIMAALDSPLDAILARFGDWVATEFGCECLSCPYFIPVDRFNEDWPNHMIEKSWVNPSDFLAAFRFAKEYHVPSHVPRRDRE